MLRNIRNAFELEKRRSLLANKGKFPELINTYSIKKYETEDYNTASLWDELNSRKHVTEQSNPMGFDRLRIASKFLREGSKVLNIGAGAGDLENYVFSRKVKSLEWFGFDLSSKSIKRLNKDFPKAKFKVGNIINIPFENKTFDIVMLMEVMEHIKPSNTFRALDEVSRVLKNNGHLVLTVPLNEGLEEMIKDGINPNAHVRVYTPKLISAELEISGFEILSRKFLYAFHNNYYLKSLVAKYLLFSFKKPNNIILHCKKK